MATADDDIAALRSDLSRTGKTLEKMRERVEVLDGVRQRNATSKAAVRVEDLRSLGRFPSKPPSYKRLDAPPTAADFNALAADVARIYEVLGALAARIADKL